MTPVVPTARVELTHFEWGNVVLGLVNTGSVQLMALAGTIGQQLVDQGAAVDYAARARAKALEDAARGIAGAPPAPTHVPVARSPSEVA